MLLDTSYSHQSPAHVTYSHKIYIETVQFLWLDNQWLLGGTVPGFSSQNWRQPSALHDGKRINSSFQLFSKEKLQILWS